MTTPVTVTPTGYLAIPVEADSDALAAQALTDLAANMPGWVPRDGHLEVWLTYALARVAATAAQVAGQASQAIFQYFGQSLLGLPALAGTPAAMPSTWTLNDTLGHTIPAGTIVGYQTSSTSSELFQTTADVVVPAGSNTTATGGVALTAVTAGAVANGLPPAAVQLFTNLAWVQTVQTTAPSAGGSDPETTTAYLARLRAQLKLLSPRPILPADFAAIATTQAGVARAAALNGYNPADGSGNNARMVAVAAVDLTGAALGTAAQATLAATLQSLREINFVVNVISPTYTQVSITTQVMAQRGAVLNTVQAAIQTALSTFLDPAHWGDVQDTAGVWQEQWTNTPAVRYLDAAAVIKQVPGVAWITSLLIGVGSGTQAAADGQLPGAAPLPTAGPIAITMLTN